MSRVVTAASVISLLLTACTAAPEAIVGSWHLESFTGDGHLEQVEVAWNTAEQPWIEFETATFRGVAGCNGFSSSQEDPYFFDDGILVPGDVLQELALCLSEEGDMMRAERAFTGFWSTGARIGVTVSGDRMTWVAGDSRLVFRRADGRPSGDSS